MSCPCLSYVYVPVEMYVYVYVSCAMCHVLCVCVYVSVSTQLASTGLLTSPLDAHNADLLDQVVCVKMCARVADRA